MTHLIVLFIIIPLISGCLSFDPVTDFNSPRSKPAVGTIVQLNQSLTFYRGTSRSYIQHGLAQKFNGIDEREPWCQFYRYEPAAALQTVRTVQPDNFIVTSSTQKIELVSSQPVMVAASTLIFPIMGDDPNPKTLSTVMKIKSHKQPEVVELKCAVFDEPYNENFVSLNQIRQTLGDVVTLKLK